MPNPSPLLRSGRGRLAGATVAGASLIAGLGLAVPSTASASHGQIAIFQDGGLVQANPTGTLNTMRALGATHVRVIMYWSSVAPGIASKRKPKHFTATNPNSYPAKNWAPYDAIMRAAKADGMTIDLTVAGGAPRWAEGSGIPSNYVYSKRNAGAKFFAWKPSAKDYGQFLQAVGKRYDGKFTPKHQKAKLPRVHFWTIWNEPNFGEDLGPQATDTSRISYAPGMYRNLVRYGWSALHRTGHGKDTVIIGDFAAHGSSLSMGRHGKNWPQGLPGNAGQTQPLPFIRTLYCLNSSGHQLTGTAARQTGCPTTRAGRRSFRKHNPGLFEASGVGDHPYANNASPRSDGKGNPNWATFPNFGRLERTLDEANRTYGSKKHYAIYNDEYGYITDPPKRVKSQSVPVKTAATYLNMAEYLSWRSRRVASYSQYLLVDPRPNPANGNAGFASGLYTYKYKAKATLNAYRLPLWLPKASVAARTAATVWGEARPARWMSKDAKKKQTVQIQYTARGKHKFKTLRTVTSNGYFTARQKFPRGHGYVRLRYTYPKHDPFLPIGVAGKTIVSRSSPITVR